MTNHIIFGGAGFFGFSLASKLSKNNDNKIYIVDNLSRGKFDQDLKNLLYKKNVFFLKIDLSIYKNFLKINKHNFHYIYNLAATVGVKNVLEFPYKVLINNYEIQKNIIIFSKKQKDLKRVYFSSTSEVFYGSVKHNLAKFPTKENNIIALDELENPRTTYMISKIYCEYLLIHSGLPYTILRLHNIYGPRMGKSHVIPELILKLSKLKNGSSYRLVNPDHSRTFCFIDDAVNYLICTLKNKKTKNQIFNIGQSSPEISIINLTKIIKKLLNKNIKIIKKTKIQDFSQNRRRPSIVKLTKYINKKFNTKLIHGLKITKQWYLEQNE
jgi:UDP-glucose 4-epimerase